jgi:hypothetical protein
MYDVENVKEQISLKVLVRLDILFTLSIKEKPTQKYLRTHELQKYDILIK